MTYGEGFCKCCQPQLEYIGMIYRNVGEMCFIPMNVGLHNELFNGVRQVIKDNYLPGKVLEKINTHSYSGFVHYAQNYIISEYESVCCIRNCYICND